MMRIFRTRGRIRREAAAWVARLASDGGQQGNGAFRRWYDADFRHAEAYDRMAAIWSAAARTSPSRAAASIEEMPVRRPLRLAVAASFATAIIAGTIFLLAKSWVPGAHNDEQIQSFASGMGEIRQIRLPDGSRVVLDSASRVDTRFTGSERRLVLRQGRARFIVAHESRPFIVTAASNEVVATGTVFDVSLVRDRLSVLLIEGSVVVRQPGHPRGAQRLAAGQKLVVAPQARPVVEAAPRGEAAWPSRMLEFENTRLEEAAAMVNRYSRVQLRLGDERTRNLRVSGAFRAGDVAGFARSLADAFALRLLPQPDGSLLLEGPEAHPR